MNREEAFNYIEIAAHTRISDRCKYILEKQYDIEDVKTEIEYYQEVMKYIKENLK